MDQDTALRKYPRLIGHMICESLGYFTPRAAANALISYKNNMPFYCEYYLHLAQAYDNEPSNLRLLKVAKSQIEHSFRTRNYHKGYMNNYALAKALVEGSLKGKDPMLASWF